MRSLKANEIRNIWIIFFKSKGHHFLEPVSLVPVDDPSLLWINSGVATLKPYFDGRMNPPSPRLTNSQKSIRTNDIENVGVTARHQTMFEMLGNFSIGDYFKKDAILMAWELLTSKKGFAIEPDLLYITVFEEDNEAYDIWINEVGIKKDHIFKGTRDTNFWDVGQGPCGPNTEIFFDRGPIWDPQNLGTKLLKDDLENDRYIEIWNIVFSQYNNDGNNNYTELPRKNIDTGAGLERMASIFQDTPTNFETDLFFPIIKKIEEISENTYKYSIENYFKEDKRQTKINTSFKVIADHIRASVFAIGDGVFPGNKDRGYIIRRLIRRSAVYGQKIGIKKTFLYKLVETVIDIMKDFYPYLVEKKELIIDVIKNEENRFVRTLAKGYESLEEIILNEKRVSGKKALLLFESFGFPIELTKEIANEMGVVIDIEEFNELLEEAKSLARHSRKEDKAWNKQSAILTSLEINSEFVGYEVDEVDTRINFMFENDEPLNKVENQIVFLTLSKTPFYAEKGGQSSDRGYIIDERGNKHIVIDVQLGPNKQHIHKVDVNGSLSLNDKIKAVIDKEKRYYTMKNHSGTHLLQAGIREVLGEEALQCGSYNDENGLRIDISFNRLPTQEELTKIHESVTREINNQIPREIIYCSLEEAIEKHKALALFTEKYDSEVRVIKFGNYSCELCGGTHVENSKDVEDLLIRDVESKGSGVYRYNALTSHKKVNEFIQEEFRKQKEEIRPLVQKFESYRLVLADDNILGDIQTILALKEKRENLQLLKDKVNKLKNAFKLYQIKVEELIIDKKISSYKEFKPENKNNINFLSLEVSELDMKEMKTLSDYLQNKHERLVLEIINKKDNLFISSCDNSITNEYSAIEILKNKKEFNVKGGGNKTFAQGKIIVFNN